MSRHRFFLTGPLAGGPAPQVLPLSVSDVHHASKVLRVRVGETIEVAEPGGTVSLAEVTCVSADEVSAEIVGALSGDRSQQPRVTLFQGVAKGDKMDAIIRQAVEVGASAIVPVLVSRCVVKLDARQRPERGERWRRVAEAAAKQAHREAIPHVSDPVRFAELGALLGGYGRVVVLWEEADAEGLADALGASGAGENPDVALLVGPEGGLSADEVDSLRELGACVATLGRTILRTETAAIVALALAIHELGGLGRSR